MIALVPQHAEKIKPPRTLLVPFELGRPLGVPDDAAFQHRVLDAALALLARNDGPILEWYTEDAPKAANDRIEDGWACPVSFVKNKDNETLAEQVLSEMVLLQPWFDKGQTQRGSTTVGVSEMSFDTITEFLAAFLEDSLPSESPSKKYSLADSLKYAAEDLKAFYNESAASQPGNASAKEVEDWYWGESIAGKLVRAVKKAGAEHADPMVQTVAGFVLVPVTQAYRDAS